MTDPYVPPQPEDLHRLFPTLLEEPAVKEYPKHVRIPISFFCEALMVLHHEKCKKEQFEAKTPSSGQSLEFCLSADVSGYLILNGPSQVEVRPKTQCEQCEHSIHLSNGQRSPQFKHNSNSYLRLFSSFCLDRPFQQLLFLLRTAFKVMEGTGCSRCGDLD